MTNYQTPKEPTKIFKEEPVDYSAESPNFENVDTQIINQGEFLYLHKPTIALFGWLEATFLCQLDFFIRKSKSKNVLKNILGRRWVYNTYDQWNEMFPKTSNRSLRRAISRLERIGVVISRREPWRKYYSINYEAWAFYLQEPESLKSRKY